MRTHLRHTVAMAVLVLLAVTVTACGGDSSSGTGSNLPTKKIAITIHGSDTVPNGTVIDVRVGQRIELDVTADKPGEIHVHSSPQEQEFEYPQGRSTFHVTPIQAPGQVIVESHTLDKVLFKLQVR